MTRQVNHYDKITTTTSGCSSTSSSTGARARSIEGISASVMHGWYLECCEYFADSFRRAPAPAIRREIAERIRDGMTAECMMAIIDEAQTAPRPSWAYCRAIINRCVGAGIKTLEDWNADQRRRQARKNPALDYEQRHYTEDEFGEDFFFNYEKVFGGNDGGVTA